MNHLWRGVGVCSLAVLAWAEGAWAADWKGPPVREEITSRATLRWNSSVLVLSAKRYPAPDGTPILFIHGLAENDRIFDSALDGSSFARYLRALGYDVWIANFRGAGTRGFRSETPKGPHHWDVEDYSTLDLPAIFAAVRARTGKRPFVVGHSLATWALEGYFAGLGWDPASGAWRPDPLEARRRQAGVRGWVSVGGVYSAWWRHSVHDWRSNPIRSEDDYYASSYELELLASVGVLYEVIPRLPALPLGWIGDALELPFHRIPFVGERLRKLYAGLQRKLIETPVLNLFYYAKNSDPEMVRSHASDGLEDLGPHLLEQIANAVRTRRTQTYFHREPGPDSYDYAEVRARMTLPVLFVAGSRDRLAHIGMIYQDGYEATRVPDKSFIGVEAGHLDVLTGRNARSEVWERTASWMSAR